MDKHITQKTNEREERPAGTLTYAANNLLSSSMEERELLNILRSKVLLLGQTETYQKVIQESKAEPAFPPDEEDGTISHTLNACQSIKNNNLHDIRLLISIFDELLG